MCEKGKQKVYNLNNDAPFFINSFSTSSKGNCFLDIFKIVDVPVELNSYDGFICENKNIGFVFKDDAMNPCEIYTFSRDSISRNVDFASPDKEIGCGNTKVAKCDTDLKKLILKND